MHIGINGGYFPAICRVCLKSMQLILTYPIFHTETLALYSLRINLISCLKLIVFLLGDITDIHVQLGECFWKKLDREGAKLSFEQSLKSSDPEITKQGKRNLSILLRQVAAASKDKEEHLVSSDQSTSMHDSKDIEYSKLFLSRWDYLLRSFFVQSVCAIDMFQLEM